MWVPGTVCTSTRAATVRHHAAAAAAGIGSSSGQRSVTVPA